MSQPTISPEETLRNTVISGDQPGSIVHDFQVILDFVAEAGMQLTPAKMLPLKVLAPLNQQLIRHIEHGLARPQQKTYPHINGLYLLLRASGLTLVETDGRKPTMVVDPEVLASWNSLNADERYFALLESWLLRADPEIIGERSGLFGMRLPLRLWQDFFRSLELSNWHSDDWIERARYWPELHNLALMELFGLVTIEDAPAEPQKGWRIKDIRATEWGDALLTLLISESKENSQASIDLGFGFKIALPGGILPEDLQTLIQPYRPAWQRTLELPESSFQDGLFVFKASLDADLWREIYIPAQSTLDDLSYAILDAYKFDDDHLYRFTYDTRFGVTTEVLHPEMDMEDGPFTDEVRIGDLPAQPGFRMLFNFDFGDNWYFDIHLERIDPPDPKAKVYRIGKRKGKSPEQYPAWEQHG